MKFNWGTGIALVYGLFALTMIAVVIRSRSYDPGLVQKDYYNLDLNYQDHLEKKQNAALLKSGLKIGYDAVKQVIRVQFPTETGQPDGFIKCYRPSTVKDDMRLKIQTGPEGQMEIPAAQLPAGLWRLEVDWRASGIQYFNEAIVTVTHA
ncbi:MAG: FixH family protein [Saprospirales bacterium]|jgi:nitrogen fixation protein FixH|nr:FixH family protein [Saprospirales bacterium]MBK8923062.1 FixH family protein [Saprospirales bacterium]